MIIIIEYESQPGSLPLSAAPRTAHNADTRSPEETGRCARPARRGPARRPGHGPRRLHAGSPLRPRPPFEPADRILVEKAYGG